jgi:maltose alpha-D-glucosyltransferase/alpha-amylase
LKSELIRIHLDDYLEEVLVYGDYFCTKDFEGESESIICDRKLKQVSLKDVAGMFRLFHYDV